MTAPLSVGLNLVYLLADSGGSARYARELIRGMLAVEPGTRITAFVSSTAPEDLFEEEWAGEIDWVRFPVPAVGSPWHMVAETAAIPAIALRRGMDVVHGLANVIPPLAPRVPTVVTLLDLIWIHYPDTMKRRETLGMKVIAPTCARAADRVIAISEAARWDIVETLGLPEAKIDVTPLGVRDIAGAAPTPPGPLRERLGLSEAPVVLCVAQKRTHKNLHGLVRAVALAREDVQLVLPGAPTPYEAEMRALAAELGIADRVRFPEWVSEEDLEGLYALASCFVLPSFQEGFGLPVLEAMRRGVPVACSNASSLPEVAGDAALLFDPHDPGQIAAAVDRLVADADLRDDLSERGRERCRHFTWEATARATLAVYRRAQETRRGRLRHALGRR